MLLKLWCLQNGRLALYRVNAAVSDIYLHVEYLLLKCKQEKANIYDEIYCSNQGMFQSIVNIFDSSSNLWNIEHLRNVLKIPQDQLKILENIPGWASGEKENIKDKSNTPLIKKANESTVKSKSVSEEVKTKEVNSDTPSCTHSINLKTHGVLSHDDVNVHVGIDKTLAFSDKKRRSSLVRSFSLSSLNKLTAFSKRVLKRSFSTSTINTDLSSNFNSNSNPEKMSSIIHSMLKEPYNKTLPLSSPQSFNSAATAMDTHTEKSQFINSAVQCQMSQCSQSEFENNENIVMATQTVDSQIKISAPVTHTIPSSDTNFELENKYETKVGSPKPILIDQIDNHVGNLNGHSQKIIKTIKSNDVPMADVEESYVSQPIPCAQPLLSSSSSALKDIEVCSAQNTTGSFEINPISNISGKVIEDISENKNNVATKRKRKNKQEKLPKKFRSMKANESEILYSSDQVRSMLKIVKLLTNV